MIYYAGGNGDFSGTTDYLQIDMLMELPASATQVDVQLRLGSKIVSGSATIDDLSIETIADPGPVATDIPLCELTKDRGGTPRLRINGQVTPPLFFFGNTGNPVIYEEIAKAATADVNLVQMGMGLPWDGTSTGMMANALQANPKAMFLPRIYVGPPQAWLNAHPELQILNEKGQPSGNFRGPSLASDLFINDVKQQLENMIRFLHNSPYKDRIIGYMVGYLSAGEWFYPDIATEYVDYSEVNRQRFSQWCAARYQNNVAALNTAWNNSLTSFSQIQVPPATEWEKGTDGFFRDPAIQRWMLDYQEYHNQLVADRIIELGEKIKQVTSNRSLVADFYGYQNELIINGYTHGLGDSGQLGWRRVLASPSVDILAAPVSYFDRGVGAPANMMSIVDSVSLAGKLFLEEDDSRTYLWTPTPVSGTLDYALWYRTEADTLHCLRRNFGNVLAHNQATWWMDLQANGSFNSDSIWQSNRVLAQTYADSIEHQEPLQPQVALLYDDDVYFSLKANSYSLNYSNGCEQRSVFQSFGAQAGYYHVQDLPNLPASVKLLIFVNTFRVDANEEALITAAKSGGRTLLWLYAPGYVNETSLSLARVSALTGFPLAKSSTPINSEIRTIAAASPITEGLTQHAFGAAQPISPTFYGTPSTSYVTLGTYTQTGKPALMWQQMDGWQSIFCGAPKLDVPILRSIARAAGVELRVDADNLDAQDSVQQNGRYLYIYARARAGNRCFQVPGEKVPNGGFEKFTGALPTSGLGRWSGPLSGSLTAAVAAGIGHGGGQGCQTGPFTSAKVQYSVPAGIALPVEEKTYEVSCWAYIDGLNAANAGKDEYIYLTFSADNWTTAAKAFMIASGSSVHLADKTWTRFTASYKHVPASAAKPAMSIQLKVYGDYSANNIVIDDFSVREVGSPLMRVTDVVNNRMIGKDLSGWTDSFQQNEQKIFKLEPEVSSGVESSLFY